MQSALFVMRRVKQILNTKLLKTLYYSLFYPYIYYGVTLWGNSHKTYINKIAVLRKKPVRIITGASYNAHTEPLLTQSKKNNLKMY